MTCDDLRALVPTPPQGYDWAECCELLPALLRLEETPQVGWQDLGLRTFRDPAELTTTRRPR